MSHKGLHGMATLMEGLLCVTCGHIVLLRRTHQYSVTITMRWCDGQVFMVDHMDQILP